MFRKALIRFGVGLFLLASVTVLATASGGSAELFRDHDGWRLVWANQTRGRRPWTKPQRQGP